MADMNNAKLATLDHIIDMMDHAMVGKAKRKGMPASVEIEARMPAEMAAGKSPMGTAEPGEPDKDDLDPETARQLMKAYEEDASDEPARINGTY